MTLIIDDAKFHEIVDSLIVNQSLSPRELHAIIKVVQLAGSVDLDDDPAERRVARTLIYRLCKLGGLDPVEVRPLSPVPTDGEEREAWLSALVDHLGSDASREVAYALAYLVIIADLKLASVETVTLEQLRYQLALPSERADEIVEGVARMVTPGAPPPANGELLDSRM